MTVIHIGANSCLVTNLGFKHLLMLNIVMFKFHQNVTEDRKTTIIHELKRLKILECVKGNRLVVGGPSINTPVERTKGFELTLLSIHENPENLKEYRDSEEHQR